MVVCPCGWEGVELERHYRNAPLCRPPPPQPPPSKRDRSAVCRLFRNRLAALLTAEMHHAHFDKYIGVAALEHMKTMLLNFTALVIEFVESECDAPQQCEELRGMLSTLPPVGTMIKQGKAKYTRIEPLTYRHLGNQERKHFVSFSIYQLVTVMLQESSTVRDLCIQASDHWKTGSLYKQKASVLDDPTAGSAFRSNPLMCGKATDAEANDLRIVVQQWQDAFTTVDGLGVKAREHKYDVGLAALINLPHRVRHYVDHILLLYLFQSKWAKDNGGRSRVVAGVGDDGKRYNDGLTLAQEVKIGKEGGVDIELPDDNAPDGVRHWRLRIFWLLASLDWLDSGEFGPFSASVAARRPCHKCFWTAKCACAFRAAADAAASTQQHSTLCRRFELRTHAGTMAAINEFRAWKGTKADLEARMTEDGIFSLHFASEHLLADVVRDPALDIMHMAFAGVSRYMISWFTDLFVPSVFSWAEVNARTQAYPFRDGERPPRLHPTKGSKRGSKSIHMNAAETMRWSLARCTLAFRARPIPPLVLTIRAFAAVSRSWRPLSRLVVTLCYLQSNTGPYSLTCRRAQSASLVPPPSLQLMASSLGPCWWRSLTLSSAS